MSTIRRCAAPLSPTATGVSIRTVPAQAAEAFVYDAVAALSVAPTLIVGLVVGMVDEVARLLGGRRQSIPSIQCIAPEAAPLFVKRRSCEDDGNRPEQMG